jgi:hypothetical protein
MFNAGQLLRTATMLVRDAMNSPLVDAQKLAEANRLAEEASILVGAVNVMVYEELKLCQAQLEALDNPEPVYLIVDGDGSKVGEWTSDPRD